MENCHGCWNKRNKFPVTDLHGRKMGNIYLLFVSLLGQLLKWSLALEARK